VLQEVVQGHPVLLNHAPTLHKLSVQAFEPILIEGKAIRLPPLACSGFNADFDGDQMSMHVPLSVEARTEARMLLLASNNVLKPSDGAPNMVPSQDMILGNYYLTVLREGSKGEGMCFGSEEEAMLAYENGMLSLQAKITVRFTGEVDGTVYSIKQETTAGRIIFNQIIPQDLGFCERVNPEDQLKLEVNYKVGKKELKKIIKACYDVHDAGETAIMLDKIKDLGYKYATLSGLTIAVFDIEIPKERPEIIAEADQEAVDAEKQYKRGLITKQEKEARLSEIWAGAMQKMSKIVSNNYDTFMNMNRKSNNSTIISNTSINILLYPPNCI
jgi:DNA-directed RNA polymerase subunit beta'